MVLADVEHCCAEVKLVEELGDEEVHLQHISHIFPLNLSEHVDEPLKVAVCWADPQEVHLLAGDPGIPVGGRSKDKIVEDGGIWGDSDSCPDHHGNLILVPILISTTKRPLKSDLGQILLTAAKARSYLTAFLNLFFVEVGVEIISKPPSPGSNGLDVNGQKILVRSRRDGERVELHGQQRGARGVDILAGQELVVGRSIELDLDHLGGKQLRLEDIELHVAAPQTDHLVEDEKEARYDEEHPEPWSLGDPC